MIFGSSIPPGLLDEFLRHLPVSAAVFDREMHYLAHSATWLVAHGDASGRSILGKSHYEVFPEIRDEWRTIHAEALAGAVLSREFDHFDPAGGERQYLRWRVAPWREEDGAIGGILIYADNITEQVRTRKRLGEHEAAIRDFFASSPLGLNLCRMDGLWLTSNEAFLRIIGYSAAEADGGLTYWQLTPREYDADEAAQLEKLRSTRRYGPYEKEFIRKDGTLVPVRLNGFLVERDGQDLIWSVIEDMTEPRALQRALEEQRLHAIQASKLATMGEMAASFTHEINNPLGIVELYAATLEESIARGDLAAVKDAISGIREAAARAGQIVRGLSRFSYQSRDEREDVVLSGVVADAVGLCRPRMAAFGVSFHIEPGDDGLVRGNALQLSQVLVNLLNNAVDAASGGPQPWVRVRIEDEAGAPFVRVAVEDSGARLPEGAEDRIFRPFYTTKKMGEGTGLGLSISRSIVEAHDGTLELDRGAPCTRFVVRLPEAGP